MTHVLVNGGIIEAASFGTLNDTVLNVLQSFSRIGVNVFALITGYLSVGRISKPWKLLDIWMIVFFYLVLTTVCASLVSSISPITIIKDLNPLGYWYVLAYTGLILVQPMLNRLLEQVDVIRLRMILILAFIFLSFLPLLTVDVFSVSTGHNALWLVYMYLVGWYLNVAQIKLKSAYWIGAFGLILFSAIGNYGLMYIRGIIKHNFDDLTTNFFNSYTSPTIFLASIIVFNLVLQWKVSYSKILQFFATGAFSVYVLHFSPAYLNNIIENKFQLFADDNAIWMVTKIFVTVFLIFVSSGLIDGMRRRLFKLFNVAKVEEYIKATMTKLFKAMIKY